MWRPWLHWCLRLPRPYRPSTSSSSWCCRYVIFFFASHVSGDMCGASSTPLSLIRVLNCPWYFLDTVSALLTVSFAVSQCFPCSWSVQLFCVGANVLSCRAMYPSSHMSSSRSFCCKSRLSSSFRLLSFIFVRLAISRRIISFRLDGFSMSLFGRSCILFVLISFLNTVCNLLTIGDEMSLSMLYRTANGNTRVEKLPTLLIFLVSRTTSCLFPRRNSEARRGNKNLWNPQWFRPPTCALIHVRLFQWYHQVYLCNPRPHLHIHFRHARQHKRSVINTFITFLTHHMLNIYTYKILMSFPVFPSRMHFLFAFPSLAVRTWYNIV